MIMVGSIPTHRANFLNRKEMNLKKFRHKNPRNKNFINKSIVRHNFSRSLHERIDEIINNSVYINVPACARKKDINI